MGVDFDGYYGYQCMDLAIDYMYQLSNGNVRLNGNAYQAKNNALGNYAKVYANTPNFYQNQVTLSFGILDHGMQVMVTSVLLKKRI